MTRKKIKNQYNHDEIQFEDKSSSPQLIDSKSNQEEGYKISSIPDLDLARKEKMDVENTEKKVQWQSAYIVKGPQKKIMCSLATSVGGEGVFYCEYLQYYDPLFNCTSCPKYKKYHSTVTESFPASTTINLCDKCGRPITESGKLSFKMVGNKKPLKGIEIPFVFQHVLCNKCAKDICITCYLKSTPNTMINVKDGIPSLICPVCNSHVSL